MFLGLFWTKIKNQNLDMESYFRPLGLEYLASNAVLIIPVILLWAKVEAEVVGLDIATDILLERPAAPLYII